MAGKESARKVKIPYGELSLVAKTLGVSTGHLSRYLSGDRPSKKLDAKMIELYGVPGSEIEASRTRDAESGDPADVVSPGVAA